MAIGTDTDTDIQTDKETDTATVVETETETETERHTHLDKASGGNLDTSVFKASGGNLDTSVPPPVYLKRKPICSDVGHNHVDLSANSALKAIALHRHNSVAALLVV